MIGMIRAEMLLFTGDLDTKQPFTCKHDSSVWYLNHP